MDAGSVRYVLIRAWHPSAVLCPLASGFSDLFFVPHPRPLSRDGADTGGEAFARERGDGVRRAPLRVAAKRLDEQSQVGPGGLITMPRGAEQQADAAAVFGRQLQTAKVVGAQMFGPAEDDADSRAAQRLLQRPELVAWIGRMDDDGGVQVQAEAAEGRGVECARAIDEDAGAGVRFSPSPPDRRRIQNPFTRGERHPRGARVRRGVGMIDVHHTLSEACLPVGCYADVRSAAPLRVAAKRALCSLSPYPRPLSPLGIGREGFARIAGRGETEWARMVAQAGGDSQRERGGAGGGVGGEPFDEGAGVEAAVGEELIERGDAGGEEAGGGAAPRLFPAAQFLRQAIERFVAGRHTALCEEIISLLPCEPVQLDVYMRIFSASRVVFAGPYPATQSPSAPRPRTYPPKALRCETATIPIQCMIRAFIAIDVPAAPSLTPVLAALARMGRAVRPVPEGALHITLKFLGDIDPVFVPRVTQAIEQAAHDSREFRLELRGLGAFPDAQRPNVIWVGCGEAPILTELARRLESELAAIGIPRETRAFHPHATLARVKARPPGELAALLNQHAATEFGDAAVHDIQLYQSELTPHGPHYTMLARIPIGAEQR